MRLTEHQAKILFKKFDIAVPASRLISPRIPAHPFQLPLILKSQVPIGDRLRQGGIVTVASARQFRASAKKLLTHSILGYLPARLLAEEKIDFIKELYVSLSFDSDTRTPCLALSARGGTGIDQAHVFAIDARRGLEPFRLREWLLTSEIAATPRLVTLCMSLWQLFVKESALIAEINPLFQTYDGRYIAGDGKVVLDDAIARPDWRPYIDLPGDIAILASGGGASMLNLDALFHYHGRPANYVEYSGNPKSDLVRQLTQRVLSKPKLKGCWVVGGTANFTDIYETLKGFVAGLRKVRPKPRYPIVIRRDGPRRAEAFAMLEEVGRSEGYDFHLFDSRTPMSQTAKVIVKLAYGKKS